MCFPAPACRAAVLLLFAAGGEPQLHPQLLHQQRMKQWQQLWQQQLLQRLQQRVRVFAAIVAVLRLAPVFLGPALEDAGSS